MYYDEVEPCINSVIASEHAMFITGFFMQNAKVIGIKLQTYEMFVYLLEKFPSGILH
jgi:hypothetical protein